MVEANICCFNTLWSTYKGGRWAASSFNRTLKEQAEWRTWNLSGLEVTQLRIDFQFHVHMWSLERDLLITFGTPFTLRSHEGEVHTFDPDEASRSALCSRCFTAPWKHSLLRRLVSVCLGLRMEPSCVAYPIRVTKPGNRMARVSLRVRPCFRVSALVHLGTEGECLALVARRDLLLVVGSGPEGMLH